MESSKAGEERVSRESRRTSSAQCNVGGTERAAQGMGMLRWEAGAQKHSERPPTWAAHQLDGEGAPLQVAGPVPVAAAAAAVAPAVATPAANGQLAEGHGPSRVVKGQETKEGGG